MAQLRRRLHLIDHPHTLAGGEDPLVAPSRLAGVNDLPGWSRLDLVEIQAAVLDAERQEVGGEPVEGGREEDSQSLVRTKRIGEITGSSGSETTLIAPALS